MAKDEMKFLDPVEVVNYLEAIPVSQVFSVTFAKKDGEVRKMRCRRGVRKKLKGGESTIAHVATLQGVYDLDALDSEGNPGAYRCFDKTRVLLIRGIGSSLRAKGYREKATTAK